MEYSAAKPAEKEWVGWKSWFASATEGEGFGDGLAPLPNLENFDPFYLVFMQYKCENNVIEQIDEITLTSNLGWIGYATISNR